MKCNKCGTILDEWDKQLSFHYKMRVPYGSIFDDELVDLNLCCNCFDDFISYIQKNGAISPLSE